MAADRWPWAPLGLTAGAGAAAVRRAYAARLKAIDRADPAAFQALRDAYEAALDRARAAPGAARPSIASLVGDPALLPPGPPAAQVMLPPSAVPAHDPLAQPLADALAAIDALPPAAFAEARRRFDILVADRLPRLAVPDLAALASAAIATDRDVRAGLERRILAYLACLGEERKDRLDADLAIFLDDTFGWSQDAIVAKHRLARLPAFADISCEIAHLVDPVDHEAPPAASRAYGWVLVIASVLCGIAFCVVPRTPDARAVMLVVGVVSFRYAVKGLDRAERFVIGLLRRPSLAARVRRAGNARLDRLYGAAITSARERSIPRVAITFALLVVPLLSWAWR